MRRFQKAAALAIGVCMTVSALAGCGGQSGESEMKTETKQEAVTEQASGQSTEETGRTGYPDDVGSIQCECSIRYGGL